MRNLKSMKSLSIPMIRHRLLSMRSFIEPLIKPLSFKLRTKWMLHLCGRKLHQFTLIGEVFTSLHKVNCWADMVRVRWQVSSSLAWRLKCLNSAVLAWLGLRGLWLCQTSGQAKVVMLNTNHLCFLFYWLLSPILCLPPWVLSDFTSPIYRTCSIEQHLVGVLLMVPVPVIAECSAKGAFFSFLLLLPIVSHLLLVEPCFPAGFPLFIALELSPMHLLELFLLLFFLLLELCCRLDWLGSSLVWVWGS